MVFFCTPRGLYGLLFLRDCGLRHSRKYCAGVCLEFSLSNTPISIGNDINILLLRETYWGFSVLWMGVLETDVIFKSSSRFQYKGEYFKFT